MAVATGKVARIPAFRRLPTAREWLIFAAQAIFVVMIEVGNDIIRGNIWRPNAVAALHNARQVVHFEAAHGLFIEPGLQTFFEHAHSFLGIVLTWPDIEDVSNNVYAFCHIFVTLGVALWIYLRHRDRFPFVRNVILFTNVLALVGYELYPMAPPRLTTGIVYNHHAYQFQDTMRHVLGTGTLNGTPIGYNPLSAMPSLHVAWAIIIGASLVFLARTPALRLFGLVYPIIMAFAVVVTANHYVMDIVGAALAVSLATFIAFGLTKLAAIWHTGHASAPSIAS